MRGIVIILFFLLLLSLAGNFYFLQKGQHTSSNSINQLQQKYPLLSRRAINPNYQNDLIVNFLPLRQLIHKEIDPYADSFAVDFEYLPTGTTISINEDKDFTAESLLKVPVVMAYFHKKEVQNITEDPTVAIQKKELNASFGDLYKKGAGYKINLGEAVKLALQKSDNTASLVLADQISNNDFQFVYDGLDIPEMVNGKSPIITAQEYTSILKALYFGSVLTNEDSEYILQLLTNTDFRDLLPSGVPANIPIAHKIGLVNKEIYQDCGIVYYPSRPYTLCMVSHSDYKTTKARMHTVSKMVYDYVNGLSTSDTPGN
jgi:beta-lactamase class A